MATTLVKVLDVPLKKAFAILVEQGNQGSATLNATGTLCPWLRLACLQSD